MIAVIQAGGKGTRISSVTEDKIPKPMLEIDDKPILYHQIMNLKKYNIDEIIIIVSHLGEVITNYFKDGSDLGVKITYVEESPAKPLGTAGALYHLKDTIKDDFIFLLGDVFINIDFNRFINFHKNHTGDVTLLTHPNNHPFDSDLVLTNHNNLVTGIDYKDNVRINYHNLVNAGVMILGRHCLDFIQECKKYNYEKDIIFPLIKEGKVYSYKSSEYVKDTGTPERYEQVIRDYNENIPSIKNLSNLQQCIFLNRDIIVDRYSESPDELTIPLDLYKTIKLINESGCLCIIVSNKQMSDPTDVDKKIETLLGNNHVYVDDIIYIDALDKQILDKYHIDIDKSYMIINNHNSFENIDTWGLHSVVTNSKNQYKTLSKIIKR